MFLDRKRLVQLGGFALAVVLLVLALRGVDFARVGSDLASADWFWMVPMAVVTLVSHWLRAWRWTLFLDTLPASADTNAAPADSLPASTGTLPDAADTGASPLTHRVPVEGAFGAILVGYMANYAAPRVGEFVRTANISTRFSIRFSAVLGTVAIERVLDVATMAVAFLTVPFILSGRLDSMGALWNETVQSWSLRLEGYGLLIAAVAIGILLLLGFGVAWLRRGSRNRFRHILMSFSDGMAALARTPHRGRLVATTLLMWVGYAVMAYLPFVMFGFHETYGVTFVHAWALMLIGAVGIVVPSPGGIGSYHFLTIQALVLMFGFPPSEAASYAIVSHAAQLVLYVVAGFTAMIVQGYRMSDLVAEKSGG